MTQIEMNETAIKKLEADFDGLSLRELFEGGIYPWVDLLGALRIYGFRCAACSTNITSGNLKFSGWRPSALCYFCQSKNKKI